MLRCTAVWHDRSAGPEVEAFADVSRRLAIAPGRGVPGRAYAFRRPTWVADVAADGNMARQAQALRAGLTAAAAFPIALADDCAGVLEFFSPTIQQPDARVVAMFATVGGQLAQYLERRRLQADESRRVEAALRDERDRAQRYLDVAGTMIIVLDAEGRVELINRKGSAVLDRPEDEMVGEDWFELAIPEHERDAVRAGFERLMAGDEESFERFENSVVNSSGELRSIAWHNTILRDADGTVTGVLSSGEDVTERLAAEQQITYLAYHDALTGLPNRTLLEQHLRLALERARTHCSAIALLQLDVDNFKLVNDSLGHGAGDQLIRELTARLQGSIAPADVLARTGGDGFLVLLGDLRDEDPLAAAERVAGAIGDRLAEPFMVAGAEFQISASIGIAVSTRDGDDAEALLAHADAAMYRAKDTARGGWAVYARAGRRPARAALDGRAAAARARRRGVRAALPADLQLRRRDRRRRGAAALARRRARPDGAAGRVHPRRRGDRADRVDRRLGDRRRLRPAGRVGGARAAPADLVQRLAAPAAPRRLRRPRRGAPARERRRPGADHDRADRVGAAPGPRRRRADPAPARRPRAAARARRLRRRLLVAVAAARDADGDAQDRPRVPARGARERRGAAIVTAILRLARALGRNAVAEGVETEAQRRFLEEQECPLMQGFLLGRPMPAAAVEALMAGAPA